MNICYQCGQTMVSEAYYQKNKGQFTAEPKFNHNEHIIQNALFGKLKPDSILCKQCGNDFSVDIDKNFVALFQMITETTKDVLIKKDHGAGSVNTIKGYLFDNKGGNQKRSVQIRDNIVSPKDPYYEYAEKENKVYIFANEQRAKQYQNVVSKELKDKGIAVETLDWEIVKDISELGVLSIFFSEGVDNFNQKFTTGFVKIAVGFATYCGIPREALSGALKIGNDGKGDLITKGNIYPFFPIGMLDSQLEMNRHHIERHYPSHTLILFSQNVKPDKKRMYCYIDLFSTFQYYVALNDDYDGDEIYEYYHQA